MAISPELSAEMQQWLARTGLADRRAFRKLYDASAPHLLGVGVRILHDRSLAEEALQDAFVQIWNKAGEYHPEKAAPMTWMSAIVRYRALDMLRLKKREVLVDEDTIVALAERNDDPLPEDSILSVPNSDLVRCMSELSSDARNSISLAFVEGLNHEEVSTKMAKPLGTVKSWIRRGLLQLRDCLRT